MFAILKLIAGVILAMFLCMFIALITSGKEIMTPMESYAYSAAEFAVRLPELVRAIREVNKDAEGNWKQILETPGYIGRNGLGKTKEGDGKTPTGTYKFTKAFGIAEDPGSAMEYYQVSKDDYWSGDQRDGYHYNEMVSIKDYPDLNKTASEHLVDYDPHYKYCLNINWNVACTPGKGSAIFLHCFGYNPYTAGCVAIPEKEMVKVLQNVHSDCVVVIDYMEMINQEETNQEKSDQENGE
jgi:L,D-peptidoglycan transpeptidase YkuD (ErfK/YbiS/YcfS/YnhG family)